MIMATHHMSIRILIAVTLGFLLCPIVNGAITTISPGNTVFIGEQGLDVTAAMEGDTQVGWWASAASIADSSPSITVPVTSPTSFAISPSTFGSYTGAWYHISPSGKANGSAFTVMDPQLSIKVEDTSVSVDVTNKWVPTDDEIRFRIESNLVSIGQRSGGPTVPITIKVQDPSGGTFSSLLNKAGTSTSLVDMALTSSPQYTNAIWDTGQRSAYPPGTYKIWVECNVNSMKDNYNVVGKTVSQTVTVQNQDHNPLITGNYPATTTTTTKTSAITTVPTTTKTPAPVTSVPIVVTTPAATMTPTNPVTQTATQPPATVVTTLSPSATTHTPGFEGVPAGIALFVALMVFCRKY